MPDVRLLPSAWQMMGDCGIFLLQGLLRTQLVDRPSRALHAQRLGLGRTLARQEPFENPCCTRVDRVTCLCYGLRRRTVLSDQGSTHKLSRCNGRNTAPLLFWRAPIRTRLSSFGLFSNSLRNLPGCKVFVCAQRRRPLIEDVQNLVAQTSGLTLLTFSPPRT
ncbi:hypothetical protein D3C87_1009240 [compost metagenome]